ncbi:MAG: YgjV family protein [Oscillospiraceae bacterium]|nr:YgjV family protein [Oscillospiraceae bacterium]
MNTVQLIAQAIGIVAMTFNIFSYQQKTRSRAIGFQLFGGLLFCINFLMLGAIAGGILNAVAVVRAIVFLNKEKLKADRLGWLIGFTAVYFLSYLLTFTLFGTEATALNLIVELLPVIGMIATTISFRLTDAKDIRKYGLISSPAWLIYNIANFSIGAIICEVLSLGSILIGIFRYDRKKS